MNRMIAAITMVLISSPCYACSCIWAGPFLQMSRDSKLVIRGTVKSYGPKLKHGDRLYASMEVEIVEVLKGKYVKKRIKLLGDTGMNCRPDITPESFGIGSDFLFALGAEEKEVQPISVCGEYWVRMNKETAVGKVSKPQMEEIGYEALRTAVREDALNLHPERNSRPNRNP